MHAKVKSRKQKVQKQANYLIFTPSMRTPKSPTLSAILDEEFSELEDRLSEPESPAHPPGSVEENLVTTDHLHSFARQVSDEVIEARRKVRDYIDEAVDHLRSDFRDGLNFVLREVEGIRHSC